MDAATPRRQSKVEAAISDEMMAFQHEFVGRGPERIRTRMVEDLVIVRSFGVFTPAERQLADSFEGQRLIKAMRQQVLEAGRSKKENRKGVNNSEKILPRYDPRHDRHKIPRRR